MIEKALLACTLGLLAQSAAAASPFFSTRNEGAFTRSFLLPSLGVSQLLATDDWSWRAQVDQTNDYHVETLAGESITLDGETTHLNYTLTQGLAHGLEWGIEVPAYYHGRGFMDRFIENWHDWFGLPNGGRELAPRDRYLYEVTRGGTVLYRNINTGWALGDVRLNGAWQLADAVALRASLKLPTGNNGRLTGENFGGALWADIGLPFAADSNWRGFVSLGGSGAQRDDLLPALQRRAVALGGFGLSYACTDRLRLTAQVNAHSALYQDTDLEALKRPGLQTTFGGSYQALPNLLLRIGVQEDPITGSSPDFSMHLGLEVWPLKPD